MKTMIKQLSITCGFVAVFVLSSCDIPIALGERLDVEGPVVTITYPAPRKPALQTFTVRGTAVDYTGTEKLLVEVVLDNKELSRQWQYNRGTWEITDNGGKAWARYESLNTSWSGGAKNVTWSLDINLPEDALDGEYTVVVQAWDKSGNSDDNSYKTRVVIVDRDPPKVNITDPFLYVDRGKPDKKPTDGDFPDLDQYLDDDIPAMHNPANIGKFLTRTFNLQYQIDDNSDVWSIEIRLYDAKTAIIDENPESSLPGGYIHNHIVNDLPLPTDPDPANTIKPNGTIPIPALDDPSLNSPVTGKTTVMVVASCFDAAGNTNQEKILGYFIYWPEADKPWITFPEKMYAPNVYNSKEEVYMVYPGRNIQAMAYQVHRVTKVEYSIYKWNEWNTGRTTATGSLTTVANPINSSDLSWSFAPPSSTGFYSVVAKAYDDGNVAGDEYEALFFVQDLSFPDFPLAPSPSASTPLYQSIGKADSFGNTTAENSIRIHGTVSDATDIASVYLVWINPRSVGYAAMSQLQYFRSWSYAGWMAVAENNIAPGNYWTEHIYDLGEPNKVWNVPITLVGEDNVTGRIVYNYSLEIDLTDHLNIAGDTIDDNDPLKSQMFLLRAANPENKCTIITYAPQGDESPPEMEIESVVISGSQDITCVPNEYALIEQFKVGDVITINGSWKEDSIGYLDFATYLKDNFIITINGTPISTKESPAGTTLVFDPDSGNATTGTVTVTATLGDKDSSHFFKVENMKDTLVVAATLKDIGGNPAEHGGSWLIRSDTLKLLRISSERPDTKYNNTAEPIEIFLEFNKPVRLAHDVTPALVLNVTAGGGGTVTATYRHQGTQSTRQYFTYTIAPGHNTPAGSYLDVTGLNGFTAGGNYWTAANYPFSWEAIQGTHGDREEIRLTLENGHTGATTATGGTAPDTYTYYTRKLPTYSYTDDRIYSLGAGKNIEIDTSAPTVSTISTSTPTGYYGLGSVISIDVTFNEDVRISGTPQLTLTRPAGATTTGTPRVNGNKITFSYEVIAGHTTGGNAVLVNSFTGTITDIAGNALAATGISSLSTTAKTLADRNVETIAPGVPVVKIKTAEANTQGNTTANVVANTVGNTTINGLSTGTGSPESEWTEETSPTPVSLGNLYNNDLWLAIDGNTTGGTYKLAALEYSVNNGTSWVRASAVTDNAFVLKLEMAGKYEITARQIDRAGNISNWSQPVTFEWDPGTLVTRITSTSSNGTYSHNTGHNTVNITVYFRKPLVFTTAPTLTLNVRTTTTGTTNFTVSGTPSATAVSSLSYTYAVQRTSDTNRHNIPGNANLDVTGLTGAVAYDSADTSTRVTVSSSITMPPAGDARLGTNKAIKIDTSPLTVTAAPTFINDSVQADGTWSGAMTMTFNQNIFKGAGSIKFEQIAIQGTDADTRYRLPAILTEAQYNRFRDVPSINSFYTRGTNGYLVSTQASDTSTKYVLAYTHDTAAIVPNADDDEGTITRFAHDMRVKEGISLLVNAQAVQISGATLTVNLTGSNALQVPGATYTIAIPAGFVQDSLGNTNAALSPTAATTGVAKPYVRVRKSQEVISVAGTPSATTALYTAVQPQTTQARMDCRTPGATIIYRYQSTVTSVTARNWGTDTGPGTGPADSLTTDNPNPNNLGDPSSGTPNTGTPSDSQSNQYGGLITLPLAIGGTAVADYQGYQWLVRAVGRTGTAAANYAYSANSEEIAYRTVLTYQVNNMADTGDWGSRINAGEQVWIRGGDAIGSSTVPGYPLTWADDWDSLKAKRAGIRLLTKTSATGDNLYNATWKWVSWEINVSAYFDMIRGRNEANTGTTNAIDAAITWQYGPRQWSYQRDGWTSYKTQYPMYPGKHRWLYVNGTNGFDGKGSVNFSTTWAQRRTSYTNVDGWTNANTATPTPAP